MKIDVRYIETEDVISPKHTIKEEVLLDGRVERISAERVPMLGLLWLNFTTENPNGSVEKKEFLVGKEEINRMKEVLGL